MFPKAKPRGICEDRGTQIDLPRIQGAQPDHERVESSSCCFPKELASFDSI